MSEASKRHDTALYKHPGKLKIHGSLFDYKVADRNDKEAFQAALDDGWCLTTDDALKCRAKELKKPEPEPEKEEVQPKKVATVATPKKRGPGRPKKKAE